MIIKVEQTLNKENPIRITLGNHYEDLSLDESKILYEKLSTLFPTKKAFVQEKSDNGLEYHSYTEWQDLGYHVIYGQKSHKRDSNGIPLFSEEQVEDYDNDERDYANIY